MPPTSGAAIIAPTVGDAGPAAFAAPLGAVAPPLPGFTPAQAMPDPGGYTPTPPQAFGPLPGFAAAPPTGFGGLSGFAMPLQCVGTLAGFDGVDPVLGGAQVVARRDVTYPTGPINAIPTEVSPSNVAYADPRQKAQIASEQDFSNALSAAGYRTVRQPTVGRDPAITAGQLAPRGFNPAKNPDLLIEDRIFDIYTPQSITLQNVRLGIADKVQQGQTDRITLDLRSIPFTVAQLRAALRAEPIAGLREIITLTASGLGRAFP